MPAIHWTTTNVFDAVGADGFIYRIEETAEWARHRGAMDGVVIERSWRTDGAIVSLVALALGDLGELVAGAPAERLAQLWGVDPLEPHLERLAFIGAEGERVPVVNRDDLPGDRLRGRGPGLNDQGEEQGRGGSGADHATMGLVPDDDIFVPLRSRGALPLDS